MLLFPYMQDAAVAARAFIRDQLQDLVAKLTPKALTDGTTELKLARCVADWCQVRERREVLLAMTGEHLLEWLLSKATGART